MFGDLSTYSITQTWIVHTIDLGCQRCKSANGKEGKGELHLRNGLELMIRVWPFAKVLWKK